MCVCVCVCVCLYGFVIGIDDLSSHLILSLCFAVSLSGSVCDCGQEQCCGLEVTCMESYAQHVIKTLFLALLGDI